MSKMELNKAIEILKERIENNNVILDTPYDNDFDEFVRIENEAIETVLEYIEFDRKLQKERME